MYQVLLRFWRRGRALTALNMKVKAAAVFVLLLWYTSSGFLYFELPGKPDLNWLDALWWSLVTMATVGYGDVFPVTPGGRYLVGVPAMVFGIGFLGYLISEIAGTILETRSRRLKGMIDITAKNHVLIVNYNQIDKVLKLVRELKADPLTRDRDICLVDDTLEELPAELHARSVLFLRGDPTRQEILRRANIAGASHVIVLAKDPADVHSDDRNLAVTLVIESLNPRIFSVVEAVSAEKIEQLRLAGADSVVCAAELAAGLIIQELQDPGIHDVIKDLVSDLGGHQIYFVPIRKMERWEYGELVKWGLANGHTVIGVVREGRPVLNCPAAESVRDTDRAIVISGTRAEGVVV